jgi:hypothetical protein
LHTARTLARLATQLQRKAPCWVSINLFARTREALEDVLPALLSLGFDIDPVKQEGLDAPGLSLEEINETFRAAGFPGSSDSTLRILSNGPGWGVAAHARLPVTQAHASEWVRALTAALEGRDCDLVGFSGSSAQTGLGPGAPDPDPSV